MSHIRRARQAVTTDKDSGIVNDANLWANEIMNNPLYCWNFCGG